MSKAGYHDCACRDCFDVAIGTGNPMCAECEESGCEKNRGECKRDDAYGAEEFEEDNEGDDLDDEDESEDE